MRTVAVIITCYNHGRYLRGAIESALQQTRAADQVLVVDDGSVDNTREVATLFSNVEYYYQTNRGLSSARNTGLSLIRTEFVIFLDADDVLLPNAIHSGVETLASAPDAAFCFGGYREIDPEGALLPARHFDKIKVSYHDLLEWNVIGMHGAVTYRSAALREVKGFDESLRYCEDYDLYLRLTRQHAVVSTSAVVAEYRRSADGLSSHLSAMLSSLIRVIESQRTFVPSKDAFRIKHGLARARRFYGNKIAVQVIMALLKADIARASNIVKSGLPFDQLLPLRVVRQTVKLVAVSLGLKKSDI